MKTKEFTFDIDYDIHCEMLNDFVEQSSSINPGLIRLNRKDFGRFIRSFSKPRYLPLSNKPYVPHLPTAHGVLPIFASDNVPQGTIRIEPKINLDEEFEKIVLS